MRAISALIFVAAVGCGGKKQPHHDDAAVAVVTPHDAAKPPADAKPPQPARSEHVVWELVPNRHTAHRAVDGEVVVDASGIGFARFIRFGLPAPRWHLGKVVDGERAAIADRIASLELPLVARADQVDAADRCGSTARRSRRSRVKLNGRKAGPKAAPATVKLEPGWQTLAVPLDPTHLSSARTRSRSRPPAASNRSRSRGCGSAHETPPGDQDPRSALSFDADRRCVRARAERRGSRGT